MKTFEEELKDILGFLLPTSELEKKIIAAHQAEMDRVADAVIGEEASIEHLKSDTYTKQEVINIFNGLLRVQRARYKALDADDA